jgi:multiple sugar transport system substrate-binding protein
MESRKLGRRDFLRMGGLAAAGTVLAACAPAEPQVIKETVEVEVEVPVKETVEVEVEVEVPVEVEVEVTAEPAPPDEVLMQYWMPSCDVECWEPHEAWAAKYTEMHPHVTFEHRGASWGDFWGKLPLELAAGTGPDMWWHHAFMASLAADGHIEPFIDEDVAQFKETHERIDVHKINGRLYFFDEGVMSGLLFYNKEMFADAGLTDADIPKSWAELVDVAKELTITGSDGEIQRAGFIPGWASLFMALKFQQGEFTFNGPGTKALIDTEGGLRAAQMLQDLVVTDKVVSPALPGPYDAFAGGLAAMVYVFTWAASSLARDAPEIEYGVARIPTLDGGVPPAYDRGNTEATTVVSSHTTPEKKAIGFDFIKWYTNNPEMMIERATGGVAPVLKSIFDDPEIVNDPVVSTLVEQTDRCVWSGFPPEYEGNVHGEIAVAAIQGGTQTIEEGLANVQKIVQEAIDDRLEAGDPILWGYQEHNYKYADEMFIPELR